MDARAHACARTGKELIKGRRSDQLMAYLMFIAALILMVACRVGEGQKSKQYRKGGERWKICTQRWSFSAIQRYAFAGDLGKGGRTEEHERDSSCLEFLYGRYEKERRQ